MNFIKFLYDLFVYLSCNYSKLPDEFVQKFSESDLVNARLFLSDFIESDSDFNQDFAVYE